MTDQPVATAPAPSVTPLNLVSTIRGVLIAVATLLIQNGKLNPDDAQTYVGALLMVATFAAMYYKNHNVAADLAAAMQSPPVVLTPAAPLPRLPGANGLAIPLMLMIGLGSLGGCASFGGGVETAAMSAERADALCSDLYAAIAIAINGYEGLSSTTPAQAAMAEKAKVKAWQDLQTERAAYAAHQAVSASLLLADREIAQSLIGKPIAVSSH